MSKVVYLLGAGASFGTREKGIGSPILTGLPIVSEIGGELESIASLLASMPLNDKELEECKQNLIKDFQDLKDQCAGITIDSYARELWFQKDMRGFSRVELLLTIFFIFEQIIHKPDSRYKSFLLKVAQRDKVYDALELSPEIGILSWNYDNQIELAYRQFFGDNYSYIRERLGIYDVKDYEQKQRSQKYCNIIKLNGTANFTQEEDWLRSSDNNTLDETILKMVLKNYDECKQTWACYGKLRLNFAWDDRWSEDMRTNKIPKLVHDTHALVVIGYTFPDYNRDIDRIILDNMTNLRNIYIQDPNAEYVKQSILLMASQRHLKIELFQNRLEQFLLPPEL
jgi:protein associated with RNAse G/E